MAAVTQEKKFVSAWNTEYKIGRCYYLADNTGESTTQVIALDRRTHFIAEKNGGTMDFGQVTDKLVFAPLWQEICIYLPSKYKQAEPQKSPGGV